MMCNHNAGERTLSEFTALLLEAGWKVQKVHQFYESWLPQIVAKPLDSYQRTPDASPTKTLCDSEMSTETGATQSMSSDEYEGCRPFESSIEDNYMTTTTALD